MKSSHQLTPPGLKGVNHWYHSISSLKARLSWLWKVTMVSWLLWVMPALYDDPPEKTELFASIHICHPKYKFNIWPARRPNDDRVPPACSWGRWSWQRPEWKLSSPPQIFYISCTLALNYYLLFYYIEYFILLDDHENENDKINLMMETQIYLS